MIHGAGEVPQHEWYHDGFWFPRWDPVPRLDPGPEPLLRLSIRIQGSFLDERAGRDHRPHRWDLRCVPGEAGTDMCGVKTSIYSPLLT